MLEPRPWYVRTRLKTRQLLLLVALGEEANIHRAADALSMSQPAASKLLRELEEMVDAPLFERLPRGMRPTLYGDVMIRHARSVLGSLDQAREEVLALKSGQLGRVAIGTVTSPAVSLLPAAIAKVKRDYPGVSVSVEIDSSNLLLDSLAQDKLDLVIGRLSAEHDKLHLRYEPFAEERTVVVTRSGHPLLEAASSSLDALRDAAWIVPPEQSVLRHRFELMFQRESLAPPSNVVESPDLLFVTSLLAQSDMLAVIADDVAQYYAAHGVLAILPLDLPLRMDDFGLITRTERLLSPACMQVIGALRQVANELYRAPA
ncbi:Galactose-binding protein regulator [Candidatus Burkholderia verschuerenii]|uniref:Galactose-binding protein regulator n=1 Tax=Candidatus Burkholderia verschuerenii TaxID=242163 RepID=A0A0L0ME32_9BURK|nr:LysR family transcriptional regulator [Candidatus Burkholderia verschuerenii]KND60535.1 Galactose-binding protein regulator [Candidatus Burkholderia verschuerenii]